MSSSPQLAFASRIKTYLSWQSLEAESRRLRNNLEKGRKSGKIPQERVGTEIQIVAEVGLPLLLTVKSACSRLTDAF